MKITLKLGYVLAAVAMLSCSDDVTNASRMRIVESLGADGSCLEGELALNMADSAVYVCVGDGQWVSMSGETGEKGDKGDQGETGEKGDKGSKGETGKKGADGTSCTASPVANGVEIYCGGVVVDTLYNGRDGAEGAQGIQGVKGEDGSSCTGRSIAGVGIEISCGEVVVDTLRNGQDGAAGESCTGRNLDGIGIEISCGGTVIDTLPGYMISSSSSLSSSSSSLSSSSTGLPTDGSCLLADCAASLNDHWIAGDHCSYGGHNYTARAWMSTPPTGDPWDLWTDEGPCTYAPGQSSYSSSSSSLSSSSSSSLYLPPDGSCLDSNCVTSAQNGYWRAGAQCSYNGHNWHAKWFATELPPDAAWADDGPCGVSSSSGSSSSGTTCVASVCAPNQGGGQYCAYDNHNWHSQWFTVALPPSDGWVDDGECEVPSSSSILSSSSSSAGYACVPWDASLYYYQPSVPGCDAYDYCANPIPVCAGSSCNTGDIAYRCKTGMGPYCMLNPTSNPYDAWDVVGECD